MTASTPISHSVEAVVSRPTLIKWLVTGLGVALLAALLIVTGFLVYYGSAERYGSELKIDLLPDRLRVVVGSGVNNADGVIVEQVGEQGFAALSSPAGLLIQASQARQLSWCLDGAIEPTALHLLWPDQLTGQTHQRMLPTTLGCHRVSLTDDSGWQGVIAGIGLRIDGPLPLSLSKLELGPEVPDARGLLEQLWREWTEYHDWEASSVHFVFIGQYRKLFSPVLAVALWSGISALLLIALVIRRQRLMIPVLSGFLLLGWVLLDIAWQFDLVRRIGISYKTLADQPIAAKLALYDGPLVEFVAALRGHLPDSPQRVFVTSEKALSHQRTRTHYHLLPHNVHSYSDSPPLPEQAHPGDYLVVLGRMTSVRYRSARGRELLVWGKDLQYQLPVKPLYADRQGILFRIRQP